MPSTDTDGPIHQWFELTYANYLVLDSDVITKLPDDWRAQLEALLTDLWRAYADLPLPGRYLALPGESYEYSDLSSAQMSQLGVSTNDDFLHDGCNCPEEPEQGDDEDDETFWTRFRAWEDEREDCERDTRRWYDADGTEHDDWDRVIVPNITVQEAEQHPCIVVPRSLLQSMPIGWQARLVQLLLKYDNTEGSAAYESCEVLAQEQRDGQWVTISDPVPYYNRGRTYIEPRLEQTA